VQVDISRADLKKRIYGLIRELYGAGFEGWMLRWEVSRRPFLKTETNLSPASLYSNLLWLKPTAQSELAFFSTILRHMGATAEDLKYVVEMHRIEEQRYQEAETQLMGVFSSVRLTKPVEAVARALSNRVSYLIF